MEVRENGDTVYLGACRTFEKVNGQIVNQSDDHCLSQGLWTITDSLGNYWTGNYHDSHRDGIWKQFDKSGKLLKETEHVYFNKENYKVKEIDYVSGQPVTLIDKPFLGFYIKNLVAIMVILFVTFFGRVFINSSIYNSENGTDFSPIYFHFGPLVTKNFGHSLLCTFTFWFSNYKPENRRLVIISNTMSVIALTIFFGIIIGLAVTGEI
ncbi:hypothetical protein ESA94_16080 [Lacibacter luteus]|uniref:MORN repeat protein n=1 Tax=Lacibacter luteus TaxID=2508719 RepID=A0A4Q1CGK6_9BACT|nr:hypothetical protein [Lacibacter luteus]RXK58905.1 hypothetical protein ESA94_16080 [Lacibacter luteus]